MSKPHLKLSASGRLADATLVRRGAASPVVRALAEAYTAGSSSHPDMRRWWPFPGSADADLLPERGLIVSRTRDLIRNHGVAEGVVQTYVDNVIGTGLRVKARPVRRALGWSDEQAEEWSNNVEARFSAYAESTWCDAARSLNFHGLTKQIFRSRVGNGEALALPLSLPEPGAPAATSFLLIEPDRLCNPNHQPDRDDLRGGIKVNRYGAPQGYWILKNHPGDRYALMSGFSTDADFVPAHTDWGRKRVIHWHDRERVGQSRGKPSLTSVLRQFKVLGDYSNAELAAAVRNAKVAMITESALSQEQLLELLSTDPKALEYYKQGLDSRGRGSIGMEDGMLIPLMLGEKFSSFSPARPSEAFEAFVLALFRQIAAGLNIPYELLLKDFSKTTYSSARAALLEAWRFFRGSRRDVITHWCQPVFELWLEEEVMEGRIEAPDFYELRPFYCRTKWIGDGRGWIDPLKEAQAAEKRLQTISTMEDECAEQGTDWEEILEQRAREKRRAEELDVELEWMIPGEVTEQTVTEISADTDEEDDEETPPPRPQRRRRTKRAAPITVNNFDSSLAAPFERLAGAVEAVAAGQKSMADAITAERRESAERLAALERAQRDSSAALSEGLRAVAGTMDGAVSAMQESTAAARTFAADHARQLSLFAESTAAGQRQVTAGLQRLAAEQAKPSVPVFDAAGNVIGVKKVDSLD